MSVMYCEYCDEQVDTDYHPEHFDDNGDCALGIDEENDEAFKDFVSENDHLTAPPKNGDYDAHTMTCMKIVWDYFTNKEG